MTTILKQITMVLACTVGLISTAVIAQPDLDTGLTVYAGATTFPDPSFDSLTLVEFPFSLSRSEFEFYRPDGTDSSLYTRIFAQVVLLNTFGERVDSSTTYFSVRASTRAETMQKGIRLFNKLLLMVAPGVYSARVEVVDVVSKRTGNAFVDKIVVVPPEKVHLSLSDPVLAYNITPEPEDSTVPRSRLARNGFVIIPNPVSVFSTTDTMIYVYAELYNLEVGEDDGKEIRLDFDIIRDEMVFRSLGSRNIVKPGETAAFAETFDIKSWSTGPYGLRLIATDSHTNLADTSSTLFRIISPQELAVAIEEYRSEDHFKGMTLQERCNLVHFVLTDPERETLNRLTDLGKKSFLDQFWKEHPSVNNPRTDISHTQEDLVMYYRYANDHFSSNEKKNDGWRSDRGRVMLTYGPWEEIESRDVPVKRWPYEIWWYHSQREGYVFVFTNQYETYRLVHSNVDGEVFNQEWDELLRSDIMHTEPDWVPVIDEP
ncbi:MAG: GWxTD domain-containing protein [candidate division Zixibacteria bacterium]|nr:GWxTD domain-containing protein [candidate division Zixibacteria bacterium]